MRNGILSGAIMLSVGGVLAKIFSAIYRIALTRILGGEGIGLYQLVFPLYSLCVVIATAGIPMAISKVIAKHKMGQADIIKKCLLFVCSISLILTIFLVAFSKVLARVQGDERLYICYLILAPTILIVALCSVLRGIFQGRRNFLPSALSNIAEQFVKLALGLVITLIAVRVGLFSAIIGAMVSIAVSEVVALIILVLFCRKKKTYVQGEKVPLKEILRDVLPITFTNVLLPIAGFIDSLLVVNLLKYNFTKSEAVFLYGLETGAVGSIAGLPTIFSFALASVILPSISARVKNKNKNFNLAIKIVLIITIPCVLLFMTMPKQILLILYGKRFMTQSIDGLVVASGLLQISSFGTLFLGINQVLSSSLQAVERRRVSVRNLCIAVAVKFIVEFALMPTKLFNIYALSLSNSICYFVVMMLNLYEIKKQFKLEIKSYFPSLLFSNIALLIVVVLGQFVTGTFNFVLIILIAVLVYLGALLTSGLFSKNEIARFKYKL